MQHGTPLVGYESIHFSDHDESHLPRGGRGGLRKEDFWKGCYSQHV